MQTLLALSAGVLFVCASRAQQPPDPAAPATGPKPGVVLLLAKEPAWQVDAVRASLAKALDGDVLAKAADGKTWLAADARGLHGAHRGVAFRIHTHAEPFAFTDEAIAHLGDDARTRLRAHRAHAVVDADPVHVAPATDAYRALAAVAAALLDETLGIGARQHGTFEVVGERTREALLGDDPLAALEAKLATSLVVFLKTARELRDADVRPLVEKEFEVRLSTDRDATDDFLVVTPRGFMLKLRGQMVVLTVRPPSRGVPERLRGHQALLHVYVRGPLREEADRRRIVARVVAALWDEQCLALNWHCDRAIAFADAQVPAKLRMVDPVVATVGNPVVTAFDPAAMEKAIEEARATWSRAAEHHASGGRLSAKFPFATRAGGSEHIWIAVTKIDGEVVHGTLDNDPADVEGLKVGSAVTCKLAELSDWLFERDGELVGGYTIKLLGKPDQSGK